MSENQDLRSAIDEIAQTHGYKTHPYASAEEFLETSDLQGVGCVVASLDLPGMDSVSLQKELG